MDIDEKLVRHVAQLARLELSEDEVREIAPQLARIFEHVDQVTGLDVGDADPAAQSAVGMDDLRGDDDGALIDPRDVLRNAPQHDGAFLVVPRFFGDAEEGEG